MKKVFVLLAICIAAFTSANAQGGGFDPAAMKERQIKMWKESDLKLTDVQIDSVLAVQGEFMQARRGLRDLTPEERQPKMKEMNEAMAKRLTSALKDEALAKKVIAYQQEQQAKMRQGGGGRPASNK
jgi:Spy/CpxP family protein refolding chaperone